MVSEARFPPILPLKCLRPSVASGKRQLDYLSAAAVDSWPGDGLGVELLCSLERGREGRGQKHNTNYFHLRFAWTFEGWSNRMVARLIADSALVP